MSARTPAELLRRRLGLSPSSRTLAQVEEVLLAGLDPTTSLAQRISSLERAPLSDPRWIELLERALIGKTSFFRHPEQLAAIARLLRTRPGPLKLWSAGCANGMEPYSLALLFSESETEVLGTDLSPQSLAVAREGRYTANQLRDLPPRYRDRLRLVEGRVPERIRQRVHFRQLNLADPDAVYPWPESGQGWDLICCRNVLIYFEERARLETLHRLARRLAPGGLLLLSPAEQVPAEVGLHPSFLAHRDAGYAYVRDPEAALPPLPPLEVHRTPKEIALEALNSAHALTQEKQPPSSRLLKALVFEEQGREADAATALCEAEAAEELDARAHWEAARAHRRLGQPAEAEAALRRALLLDPNLWEAAFQLAGLLYAEARYPEAAQAYARTQRLLQAAPDVDAFERELVGGSCGRQIAACKLHEPDPLAEPREA